MDSQKPCCCDYYLLLILLLLLSVMYDFNSRITEKHTSQKCPQPSFAQMKFYVKMTIAFLKKIKCFLKLNYEDHVNS